MSNKNSIEKVYNKIIEIGKIRLDTLIKTGRKVKDDMRRDALYYNEYESQQYSNVDQLDQLTISNDCYLVLSYKGYNDDQEFEHDEVWMNGKNLENFKDFLVSAYNEIVENANKIYGKKSVNNEYEDYVITTGRDDEGNGFGDVDSIGHKVYVYPEVCFTQETEKPYNAVVLCIEDKDGKVYGQEMAISTFGSIATIIERYDLLADSRSTMIEAMLYQILNSGAATTSSSVSRPSTSRPLKSRNGSRINRKPLPTRPSLSELVNKDNNDDDDDNEAIDVDVEEDVTVEKKTSKKASGKKTVTKKKAATPKNTSKVGLSDILNEAEDVTINLDDEEEEY